MNEYRRSHSERRSAIGVGSTTLVITVGLLALLVLPEEQAPVPKAADGTVSATPTPRSYDSDPSGGAQYDEIWRYIMEPRSVRYKALHTLSAFGNFVQGTEYLPSKNGLPCGVGFSAEGRAMDLYRFDCDEGSDQEKTYQLSLDQEPKSGYAIRICVPAGSRKDASFARLIASFEAGQEVDHAALSHVMRGSSPDCESIQAGADGREPITPYPRHGRVGF